MERSIVIGKTGQSVNSQADGMDLRSAKTSRAQMLTLHTGFPLLDLMIVMFIMVRLVTVALPQYQRAVLHAKESVLRDDLFKMRSLIDQYAADKGKLPQSLDDLVTAKYMREIPVDPMTDENTWNVLVGEDPNSSEGEQGVIDVHSYSQDISSDENGKPYSEW